jgi:uncharacterized membrane protein
MRGGRIVSGLGKYAAAALLAAIATHFAIIVAIPRVSMNVAFERLSAGGMNSWRVGDRVTPLSRTIVRPSPDFAYSACAYDLSDGPLTIRVAPWPSYWSLSLYADNSDNYFVIDDREARAGVELTLVRRGARAPEDAPRVVQSPSGRGIALIRRLAPTVSDYDSARAIAREDVCAAAPTQ